MHLARVGATCFEGATPFWLLLALGAIAYGRLLLAKNNERWVSVSRISHHEYVSDLSLAPHWRTLTFDS